MLSRVSKWTGTTGENYALSIVSDNSYTYVGLYTGEIIKLDNSTFLEVDRWVGGVGEDKVRFLMVFGSYLYAALDVAPGKVIQINPSTMATVAIFTGIVGQNYCHTLTNDGTYIYAGFYMDSADPSQVEKIDTTMTGVSTWTGAAGEGYCRSIVYSDYLYVSCWIPYIKILKVDITTMLTVATYTGTDSSTEELIILQGKLFAALGIIPAKVLRLDLDLNYEDEWVGATGEEDADAFTTDGNNLIVGLDTTPPIIKILDPESMIELKSYTGSEGMESAGLSFIEPYIYNALATAPAIVEKIIDTSVSYTSTIGGNGNFPHTRLKYLRNRKRYG